jgi:hypothetical protein
MLLAIFALQFINVIAQSGVIIMLVKCLLSFFTRMSHYLVERFDSINYHLFGQRNFPIELSGIFLIIDDVINIVIQL